MKPAEHSAVTIYADGACSPNPGPGGYGVIVDRDGQRTERSGGFRKTTNNRMEILGAVEGLKSLAGEGLDVTIYSDSRYVVDMFNGGYARRWRAHGWMRDHRQHAVNPDLWGALLDAADRHKTRFLWVRGHNEHPENERCDQLAVAARQQPDLPADAEYERVVSAPTLKQLDLFAALAAPAPVDPCPPGWAAMKDVAFVAECDRSEQRYVELMPAAPASAGSCDVLIALHGHGADRWQFVRDGRDECRAARDAAAEHAMIFVSPDYRACTSWMGPKAEADLVQIIADLKRRHRGARVLLCGGSMGGTASLTFAALHPHLVDGVASMNGTANLIEYANFQDAIAESFGGTQAAIPEEYRKRSAEFFPERLTMPVGITSSGRDESVPPHSVLRLAAALTALQRDVLLIHREEEGHQTRYADARAILEFVIRRAARPRTHSTT